ncbi:MAG: transglycosylase SLT domain-containing protein, partial [Steroidobacteraceae bacterium]
GLALSVPLAALGAPFGPPSGGQLGVQPATQATPESSLQPPAAVHSSPPAGDHDRALFPEPVSLEPAVDFWIKVYTRIDTDSGYIHDAGDLDVIYETLHFDPGTSRRERERLVGAARARYVAALRRIAATTGPLSPDDERIRDLWGPKTTRSRLLDAADDIRFQLGQSDRFREGLERSGRWERDIAQTLARLELPSELAVLPLVESSFNPRARSKDGAAGLWQFMRATGRRYMRINSTVDERLDPFSATEAAAQLLRYDHRLLGTWPLAITAYNHGAAGMRRAVDELGTEDIGTIVRDYQSRTFGFASRNFYASFLAALRIDRDPERYFGPIHRDPEARFQVVRLPRRISTVALERALHLDRSALRALNPALRPVCWSGRRAVPRGYRLRLPTGGTRWTPQLLAARLQVAHAAEAVLASTTAEPVAEPVANAQAPTSIIATSASIAAATASIAQPAASVAATSVASDTLEPTSAEPTSATEADALGPALGPAGAEGTGVADPIDYSVAKNGTIVVAAAETLGHYAEWLDVSAWSLRRLNHMRYGRPVVMGHRIRLSFRRVGRESFEAQRLAYHRALEESYFAAHRITGTRIYLARRGDSLWNVTERNTDLPIWLLEQYNPDIDFSDMRPGTQIVVPRVEEDPD